MALCRVRDGVCVAHASKHRAEYVWSPVEWRGRASGAHVGELYRLELWDWHSGAWGWMHVKELRVVADFDVSQFLHTHS